MLLYLMPALTFLKQYSLNFAKKFMIERAKLWIQLLKVHQRFCFYQLNFGRNITFTKSTFLLVKNVFKIIRQLYKKVFWLAVIIMSRTSFRVNLHFIVCLNIKELLAWSRHHIWSLSDSNRIRTYNHLFRKRTLNHLAKLAVWLNG